MAHGDQDVVDTRTVPGQYVDAPCQTHHPLGPLTQLLAEPGAPQGLHPTRSVSLSPRRRSVVWLRRLQIKAEIDATFPEELPV